MAENCWTLLEMAGMTESGLKWLEMSGYSRKCLQCLGMVGNGWKRLKFLKLLKIIGNGKKNTGNALTFLEMEMSEIAGNLLKLLEMAGNS